jgi:hypothetical protein
MRISLVPNLITPLLYNIQQQNRLYRRIQAQNHRQSRRIMTGRVCKLTHTSIFPTNIFFPVSLWIRLCLQRPKYCFRHGALVVWAYALLTFVWPLSPSSSSFALQTPNKTHLAPPKHLPVPCLQPARVLLPPCLRITFADIIVQLTPNKCFTVGSASIFPATFTINLKQSHNLASGMFRSLDRRQWRLYSTPTNKLTIPSSQLGTSTIVTFTFVEHSHAFAGVRCLDHHQQCLYSRHPLDYHPQWPHGAYIACISSLPLPALWPEPELAVY